MSSSADTSDQLFDEKHLKEASPDLSRQTTLVDASDADPLVAYLHEHRDVREATPDEAARLSKKLHWIVVPVVSMVTLMLYIDKSTLGQASILGLLEDTNLNQQQFDNLSTFFYVGFGLGVWPMGYLLNKLPVGKFVTAVFVTWAIIIGLHPLATNYAGLSMLRFFLGVVESGILPSNVVVLNSYFTKQEQGLWWLSCISAGIPAGFIAYGCLYVNESIIHPWRLFFAILGGLTLLVAAFIFVIVPDNPSKARFLSAEEKVWAIRRLQVNNSAIENKKYKAYQMREALRDPKCWLFALHIFLQEIPNNLGNQENLIIVGWGFSNLDTLLLGMIGTAVGCFAQVTSAWQQRRWKNRTALIIVMWYVPALVTGILLVALPWSNKVGLLASLLANMTWGVAYANSLLWANSSNAGHTKRVTMTQMFIFTYSLSNIISPQLWQAKDQPRYYMAWGIQIAFGWVAAPLTIIAIHFHLKRQNRIRAEKLAAAGGVQEFAKVQEADGELVTVLHGQLDLTDFEDLSYVYPL
ncbi:hypothetical protein MNV49_001717 [Pseudohyphozyma bogoriensis]|nr:hypothetical protein MNV49_001717 [Pseudohyphozyma bogoriensis]